MALLFWVGRLIWLTAGRLTSCLHYLGFGMKTRPTLPSSFCLSFSVFLPRFPCFLCVLCRSQLPLSPSLRPFASFLFTHFHPHKHKNTQIDCSRLVLTQWQWLWQLVRDRGVWRRHQEVHVTLLPVSCLLFFRREVTLWPLVHPLLLLVSSDLTSFSSLLWLS